MLEIIDCEQNSADWFEVRRGIVTASNFATVMAKGKGNAKSVTRQKYMYQLAGEILTGEPAETFTSADMERGHVMEGEAADYYQFMTGMEAQLVGFIRNGPKGASPDRLVGSDGLLEIKTNKPSVLIERILRDDIPPEHVAQIQGQIWVAEREWCDLCCYWPNMPTFIKRANRDNGYIANLAGEVNRFNDELAELVEKLKSYGRRAAA